MAKKSQVHDEVISRIMVELDAEQAEYQKLYSKLYGETDMKAKQIYTMMTNLCKRIRMEISRSERK